MIIGVDVGGTFTDLVAIGSDGISTAKVPTSQRQSDAIVSAVESLADGRRVDSVVHGTTVATNALLERRGVRTALITDEGFEDVLEIGRQDRPSLYDPFADRPDPLVARSDRHGLGSDGATPDVGEVGAVAIAFINGHLHPEVEREVRDRLIRKRPDLDVSISSEVSPEFREFERVSTTVLNAYLTPACREYLNALHRDLVQHGPAGSVSVMRSSGGLMAVGDAARLPAAILLSGPAGGVVAASSSGRQLGRDRLVSFDMGGTSTDVCLIEAGRIEISYERSIDGFACRLPAVGIHTVGAGGGSIAWVDEGGSLRVGPHSSGAHPGPAAYGLGGTDPTVTDANVVLGRIGGDAVLGESLRIRRDLAFDAVANLADRLGIPVVEAAVGIARIAEETMAGAVRTVMVEQGVDPSGASLIAFGGAGGLHASAVARRLGMASVIVPAHAGVLSALGLLLAPPRADAVVAVHASSASDDEIEEARAKVRAQATTELEAAGHQPRSVEFAYDVRYVGQAHEIAVPMAQDDDPGVLVDRFEDLHRARNGFARTGDPIEVVAVRCVAAGDSPLSSIVPFVADEPHDPQHRSVVVGAGAEAEAAVLGRGDLPLASHIPGPAIIEDDDATTFVDLGERVIRHANGSIEVTW